MFKNSDGTRILDGNWLKGSVFYGTWTVTPSEENPPPFVFFVEGKPWAKFAKNFKYTTLETPGQKPRSSIQAKNFLWGLGQFTFGKVTVRGDFQGNILGHGKIVLDDPDGKKEEYEGPIDPSALMPPKEQIPTWLATYLGIS